jgi:hypothetical protein
MEPGEESLHFLVLYRAVFSIVGFVKVYMPLFAIVTTEADRDEHLEEQCHIQQLDIPFWQTFCSHSKKHNSWRACNILRF